MPVSSASGMNSAGPSRPRRGCCQWTWASTHRHVVELVQGDPRLVVEAKLSALDRLPDRGLELDPRDRPLPRVLVEQLEARAAPLLGPVHRGIGLADDRLRRDRRVGDHRDADADRDRQLDAVDLDRRARGLADAVGDQHHLALGGEVLEQERELVPAEPGHGVHRAQQRAQPLAERRQQAVADGVAAGVVDLLEVVEVEEHARRAGSPSGGRARARRRAGRGTARGWAGPVSWSCSAWWASSASARLRSIAWMSARRSSAGWSSDLTRQSWAPALTAASASASSSPAHSSTIGASGADSRTYSSSSIASSCDRPAATSSSTQQDGWSTSACAAAASHSACASSCARLQVACSSSSISSRCAEICGQQQNPHRAGMHRSRPAMKAPSRATALHP